MLAISKKVVYNAQRKSDSRRREERRPRRRKRMVNCYGIIRDLEKHGLFTGDR